VPAIKKCGRKELMTKESGPLTMQKSKEISKERSTSVQEVTNAISMCLMGFNLIWLGQRAEKL